MPKKNSYTNAAGSFNKHTLFVSWDFFNRFFFLLLVCCYACQSEKSILSAYSSLYFIYILILTSVTRILLSAFSTNEHFRIFRLHLLIEFIICTNTVIRYAIFLSQMTNGSFSRSWIFNELLRSIDFIRIVREKENSKISWKKLHIF